MSVFEHNRRTRVFSPVQHPLSHTIASFKYSNEALPDITNAEDALHWILSVLYPRTQHDVATPADLPPATQVCTISNGSPAVVSAAGHKFGDGDAVKFATDDTLPTPLVPGTTYYVQSATANTFNLSTQRRGGTLINTTTAGAGNHSFGNNPNDYRIVMDDGDGKYAGYRWMKLEGDLAFTWHKVYDMDWGLEDVLTHFQEQTQDLYVFKYGMRERDPANPETYIAGVFAGQHIYGGDAANTNLTLFANSGDVGGAHTGFVQVDDSFRPCANETYSLGTAALRWQKLFTKDAEIGTLTVAPGAGKMLFTSTDPELDFAALNLTTTGTGKVGVLWATTGFRDNDIAAPIAFGDAANTGFSALIVPAGSSLLGAVNAIQESQANEENTGLLSWGGAGSYYTIVGGSLRIDRPGTGYIAGKKVPWAAPQTTAAFAANTLNYVYIDSTGTIGSTTVANEALCAGNIVLFEVLYDGANYMVVKEDHPYRVPVRLSLYLHQNVGTVIRGLGALVTRVGAGTGAAGADREIKIVGADVLEDHGLETTIPDSAGAGVTWNTYHTNALGKWVRHAASTEIPMRWNNAGTPTALPIAGSKFSVVTLYASKDDLNSNTPTYYAVMDNAQYTSVAQATTAINKGTTARATNELANLELAQLGYAIIENTAAGGYVNSIIISKSSFNSRLIGGGNQGSASLVSLLTGGFNGWLSATDTTVQVALETLDDLKFHMVVDNLDFDGNTIATTDLNGDLLLAPNGTGNVLAPTLRPHIDNVSYLGLAAMRWQKLFLGVEINDGTNAFAVADLMKLRNILKRDDDSPAQVGDVLIYNGTDYRANVADAEVKHELVSGLHSGAAVPSTNPDAGHPQFALLAGRAGGQTIQGGDSTSNGADLILESTAHAAKGRVKTKDPFTPAVTASYSGGVWSGTDLGDATFTFRHLVMAGEAKGLRAENFLYAGLPAFSGQNIGRLMYATDVKKLFVDTGTAVIPVSRGVYKGTFVADGVADTYNVDVSANIQDARQSIRQLSLVDSDYRVDAAEIFATSASNVRIVSDGPLPAGTYQLIVME